MTDLTENKEPKTTCAAAGRLDEIVICRASSMYKDALVMYEKPGRKNRVFAVIITDDDLRFDIYCNDAKIINLENNSGQIEFNNKNIGTFKIIEVHNEYTVSKIMVLMDRPDKLN